MKRSFVFWLALFLLPALSFSDVEVFTQEKGDGSVQFYANNYALTPYQLLLKIDKLKNLAPSTNLPFYTILPPKTRAFPLLTLSPLTNWRKTDFRQSYSIFPGDPGLLTNTNVDCLFPFEHGAKYQVYQGYNGKRSHRNVFAVDFSLAPGTPVCAALDGIVIATEDRYNRGGPYESLRTQGNFIMLYHPENGTFSQYYHLLKKGVKVKFGQSVKAGDVIGFSGNTGYTSGPHLHFTMSKPNLTNALCTIPTRFLQPGSNTTVISNGAYYIGYQPGKGEFLPVTGALLSNEMLASYYRKVKTDWAFEVYPEDLDDTTMLLAKNGCPEWVKVTVNVRGTNLSVSRGLPYTAYVAPNSESYLLLFRPSEFMKKWNKSYSFTWSVLKKGEMDQIRREIEVKRQKEEAEVIGGS